MGAGGRGAFWMSGEVTKYRSSSDKGLIVETCHCCPFITNIIVSANKSLCKLFP